MPFVVGHFALQGRSVAIALLLPEPGGALVVGSCLQVPQRRSKMIFGTRFDGFSMALTTDSRRALRLCQSCGTGRLRAMPVAPLLVYAAAKVRLIPRLSCSPIGGGLRRPAPAR